MKKLMTLTLALAAAIVALLPVPAWTEPVRAAGDGLTVELSTDPAVVPVGRATVHLRVLDDGKPLEGADVRVLVRMPGMDMGEREEAAGPVEGMPGHYKAPAVFAMAGSYVADVTVSAQGKKRALQLKLATGMDTSGTARKPRVWMLASLIALVLFAVYTVIRMRKSGQRLNVRGLVSRGGCAGVLVLAAALAVSVYAVRHWRRPGAMTPIEAQAMEMATPPPVGTASVKLAAVDRGPVEETVTYVGQVAGWVEQDIYPRVQGWIVEMPVYVGSRVRPGDLLARLDTTQVRPMVQERTAGVQSAREAERVAEAEVTQARASVTRAEAEVQAQAAALSAAREEAGAAAASLSDAREALASAKLMIQDAAASLAAAEEENAYRSAELRRMQSLRERGAVSVQELERARAEAASASAARDQARVRLGQAEAGARSAEARVRSAERAAAAAEHRAEEIGQRLTAARADLDGQRSALAAALAKLRAARAQTRQADAMLLAARTAERYTEIRATANGVVTSRLVAPGVLASPGQSILRVAQTHPLRLQANASEADLARLHEGAPVQVWRQARPDEIVRATITSISRQVDPETRTAMVEAVWREPTPAFVVGEAITMRITVASRPDVLRVPAGAVQERVAGGRDIEGRRVGRFVWLASQDGPNTVARRVEFVSGVRGDRYYEVLSGLSEGDLVVIDGWESLREGDRITAAGPPDASGHGQQHQEYVCPMCPGVRSDKPGACPHCGMDLVPKERQR